MQIVPKNQLERFTAALVRKGMNLWEKNGNKRVYMTDGQHLEAIGIFSKYGAEAHGGERIYLDAITGEIVVSNIHENKNEEAKKAVREYLSSLFNK